MIKPSRSILFFIIFIGIFPFQINAFFFENFSKSSLVFWSVEIFSWIIWPTIVYTSIILIGWKIQMAELGFSAIVRGQNSPWFFFFVTVACSCLLWGWFVVARHLGKSLPFGNHWKSDLHYNNWIPGWESPYWHITAVLYLALTAAVVEEFYYRGLLKHVFLGKKFGGLFYILVSSFLFSLSHWEMGIHGIFTTFLYGLLASSIFLLTQNIWSLILAHLMIDLFWLS